jgi:NYN domain
MSIANGNPSTAASDNCYTTPGVANDLAGLGRHGQLTSARGRFPARMLHLVDIENLAGDPIPSLGLVRQIRGLYCARPGLGPFDQVVIASSHLTLLNAALGWPHARYRVRSGPDGADLELLDAIAHENVAARFAHIAIGSGDGIFADAAASLAEAGVWVTVVSRRRGLSKRLRLAAHEVVFIDPLEDLPSEIPA